MRQFLQGLDTPGGHILVCVFLILMGAGLWKLAIPKTDDLIVGAAAVLFAAMRGKGGNPPPPLTVSP